MATFTINITDTEQKCAEYVAYSVQEYIENAASALAIQGKTEILAMLYQHCNANNITIATGEDAQVTQAYDLGVVQTAAARNAENEAAAESA
jgi:hypothetical protein